MYRTPEMIHHRIVQDNTKLLIGSSILKGTRGTRGLNPEVEISTNPGADSKRILEKLRKSNLDSNANVIVYIGGNDVSNGRSVLEVSNTIEQIV